MSEHEIRIAKSDDIEKVVAEANRMWIRMMQEIVSYFDNDDWRAICSLDCQRDHDGFVMFFKDKIEEHGKRFLEKFGKGDYPNGH